MQKRIDKIVHKNKLNIDLNAKRNEIHSMISRGRTKSVILRGLYIEHKKLENTINSL